MDKLSDLQERNSDQEGYRQKLIDANKPQPEEPQKPGIDYIKILTDAALRNPKEVNEFMDEYIGKEGKALLISGIKQSNPAYALIVDRIFPLQHGNGNSPGRSPQGAGRDLDDSNPLDDNNPDKSYDIPDTEILDEVRNFACSMHLSGYGWAQISDNIFSKYDIDWNPLKIKDIVLKNLAWNHRTQPVSQPVATIPIEAPPVKQEQRKGLIRRFLAWLI